MHYFIDGYNLLFRSSKAGEDLQRDREEIIFDLGEKLHVLNIDATLVFDSQYREGSDRFFYKSIEILFSNQGQTADDLILQELKRRVFSGQQTVVTSDKKLAWLSRRKGAKTESVEEFINWLDKRYENRGKQRLKKEKQIEKLKPKPQKKPKEKPSEEVSVEQCFAYYIEIFEGMIQAEQKKEQAEEGTTPPKLEKPKKAAINYLKIFRQRFKDLRKGGVLDDSRNEIE